jgi:hypothetical protein
MNGFAVASFQIRVGKNETTPKYGGGILIA